jgi:hypothetical protein
LIASGHQSAKLTDLLYSPASLVDHITQEEPTRASSLAELEFASVKAPTKPSLPSTFCICSTFVRLLLQRCGSFIVQYFTADSS